MPISATSLSQGSAAGYYADETDLSDFFGSDNITRWSQLDNATRSADDSRIQLALDHADAEIDNFFQYGPYAVPLVLSADQRTVTHWAVVIAGVWLYTARVGRDLKGDGARYSQLLADVYADMGKYKSGVKRLSAAPRWPAPTGPAEA